MFINILFDVLFVIFQLYQWNFFDYSAFWINLPYRVTCKFHVMYQWSIYYHTVASSPKQSIYSNSYYILSLVLPIKRKIPNNYDLLNKLTLKNPTTEDEDVYELGENIFFILYLIFFCQIFYTSISSTRSKYLFASRCVVSGSTGNATSLDCHNDALPTIN